MQRAGQSDALESTLVRIDTLLARAAREQGVQVIRAGDYVLVRMKPRKEDRGKQNWLLIKKRDEHAGLQDRLAPRSVGVITDDGGRTWRKVSGLPSGNVGRIGLDISRRDPNQLTVIVENLNARSEGTPGRVDACVASSGRGGTAAKTAKPGGPMGNEVYRSTDGGRTWRKTHSDGIDYGEYIEQITYLLFLKMADERGVKIPKDCDWPSLRERSGIALTEPGCGTDLQAVRTCAERSSSPHRVIRRRDSVATARFIFDSPRSRSRTSMGTSTTRNPARTWRVRP